MHDETNDDKVSIRPVDCAYWVHECNRYLFLAKVHIKEDKSVIPKIDGDPLNYIDIIINISNIKTDDISDTHKLVVDRPGEEAAILISREFKLEIDLSEEDIQYLRKIFSDIVNSNWNDLEIGDIELAQGILYRLLRSIRNADRLMEGYP